MAPLILFTSGYYHQTLLQTRFRDAGLTPNVVLFQPTADHQEFCPAESGRGLFITPAIEPGENIIALPVDPCR